jgi:hypothetical protein
MARSEISANLSLRGGTGTVASPQLYSPFSPLLLREGLKVNIYISTHITLEQKYLSLLPLPCHPFRTGIFSSLVTY